MDRLASRFSRSPCLLVDGIFHDGELYRHLGETRFEIVEISLIRNLDNNSLSTKDPCKCLDKDIPQECVIKRVANR